MNVSSADTRYTADTIGFDAADLDRDIIAERLQQDVVRLLRLWLSTASLILFVTAGAYGQTAPQRGGHGELT